MASRICTFAQAQEAYDHMEPDWADDYDEEEDEDEIYCDEPDFDEDAAFEARAQRELDRYLNWLYK